MATWPFTTCSHPNYPTLLTSRSELQIHFVVAFNDRRHKYKLKLLSTRCLQRGQRGQTMPNGSLVWSPGVGELSNTTVKPPTGSQLDDAADGDSILALAMALDAMTISPTERDCEAIRPADSSIRRQQIQQWAASVNREMDNSWDISAQTEFAEAQQRSPIAKFDQNDTLKWMQAVCSSLVRPVWISAHSVRINLCSSDCYLCLAEDQTQTMI
ncbi:hypothetical protein B0H14DRAFT_2702389 [Mycena olivaceomarginata]|nr:hypothetical protein B0H14DRAFT_2702389 [Mycena olivaceomarginata]